MSAPSLVPAEPRSLSPQEAAVMAWLEADRRPSVTTAEVAETLKWPRSRVNQVLFRLTRKGWLRRTARGRYETVLAETGGFAPPNPWAALATWEQAYYVGFQSAAYELGLTPDRPGDVQSCVPVGARRPSSWHDIPIALVWLRSFSPAGVEDRDIRGWTVRMATPAKVLLDGATVPARVGGLPGLARVVASAQQQDFPAAVSLGVEAERGQLALRRLAAMLHVLDRPVPELLASQARPGPSGAVAFLGERSRYGSRGPRLQPYGVVINVDVEALREEIRR